MRSKNWMITIILIMTIAITFTFAEDEECPNHCENGVFLFNGILNSTGSCAYEELVCEFGCDVKQAKCKDAVNTACNEYCINEVHYYSGQYNATLDDCDYKYRYCEFGCDDDGITCRKPELLDSDCPDYWEDDTFYHDGVLRADGCIYKKNDCFFGCDSEGLACEMLPGQKKGCSDYCANSVSYYDGVYNDELGECEYKRKECFFGCYGDTCKTEEELCPDYCTNDTLFFDGYYDEACLYLNTTCEFGCINATCFDPQCIDPDETDIFSKGNAKGLNTDNVMVSEDDYCMAEMVVEYSCSGRYINETFYSCPKGFVCNDGACQDTALDTFGRVPQGYIEIDGKDIPVFSNTRDFDTDILVSSIQKVQSSPLPSSVEIGDHDGVKLMILSVKIEKMIIGIFPVSYEKIISYNSDDLSLITEDAPWWSFLAI